MDNIKLVTEKFVVEENLNYDTEVSKNERVDSDNKTIKMSNLPPQPTDKTPPEVICRGPHTFDPLHPQEEDDNIHLATTNNQTKVMRWHYCLGYIPFIKLKQLALNGKIPKKLVKVKPPKCAGCLFGTMTTIPWCGKEDKASREVFIATKPGECVSVNQMMSTEVGFYAQMKGNSPRSVTCASLSSLTTTSAYALSTFKLMTHPSKPLLPNVSLTFAAKYSIKIQHYHCDNGQFFNNAFKQACQNTCQQLTFCGVNAHFQNGIAKQFICDLLESECKQLLHACACWLQTVHFAQLPYALHNAALLHNSLPVLEDSTWRLELFSSIRVGCNMKHVHTFGCPVFVLQNFRQTIATMVTLCALGLNLGPNPMHVKNVYVVLNSTTRCVSPQYHCRFDDIFETTQHGGPDVSGTICW